MICRDSVQRDKGSQSNFERVIRELVADVHL